MAVDDFVADPEAEAGAVEAFGGEEGFEDAGAGFGGDADAGVGEGEGEAGAAGAPVGCFAAAKEEAASGGHGIDGVGDEVVEDLTDVAFEAGDLAVGALAFFDGDGGVAEAAFVEAEDGGEEVGAGDLAGRGGLLVEAEGLVGDDGDAAEFLVGEVEEVLDLGDDGVLASDIEEVGDGLEGVVDLVSDGAGHATDGGELLALDESGFGALLMGGLDGGCSNGTDGTVFVEDGRVVYVPVALLTGAAVEGAFEVLIEDVFTSGSTADEGESEGNAGGEIFVALADGVGG